MGRTKEKGRPVSELLPVELRQELHRCRMQITYTRSSLVIKLLKKRVYEIEKRMARESNESK